MDLFLEGDDAAADGRNRFTDFALSNKSYTQTNLDRVSAELAGDPTVASQLLQSSTCRAIFLSDFSERVERILTWLNPLAEPVGKPQKLKHSGSQLADIIHSFARGLVIPLLESEYSEYHPSRGFADLVITTTRLSYAYRKRGVASKTHKVLLEKIAQSGHRHLMRFILSSIDGAKLIQTFLAEAQAGAEVQAVGSTATLAKWTTAAVELCRECSGNHGLHAELAKWKALVELGDSLAKILVEENNRRSTASSGTASGGSIDFSKLRVMTAEDKKSGITNTREAPKLSDYLSPRDFENLELFNLRPPTGLGPLEGLITRLREQETFCLFHALVKSFPCALCLRRDISSATGSALAPPKMPHKQFSVDSLPTSFTSTLLGRRLGPWKICLSEHAFKDLLSANKEGYLSSIARRMKELASGQWAPKSLRKPLSPKMVEECGGSVPVPLWRATYGSNGRILWQINLGYDEEYEAESQIITVWRIGTADEVREYIPQVVQVQKTYTPSRLQKSHLQYGSFPLMPETYMYSQSDDTESKPHKDDTQFNAPHMIQNEGSDAASDTLMCNKFYCVTGKVLDHLFSARSEIEFPFDISREEIEIVKHSNSAAFILGRSGTGKTTCLLFKLLCRNIASRAEQTPVRQIFITRSSFLAERLKDYLRRLMESQRSTSTMRTDMPRRAPTEYILREARDPLEEETLDTLGDDKFPLVCTFDQLFGFLERVVKINDRNNFDSWTSGTASMHLGSRVRRLIDYNVFNDQYWKRHYNNHKDGLEPDLVFAEILGIIKGSTSAERDFRPLSRDEYVEMSIRKAPVFTNDISRNTVYDMYQDYERQKKSVGDRDDIDRVTQLLKSFEKDQNLKKRIQALFDEVYVDEVQDNKLLEIDLMFTLVRNPYGIHFAGDTAQCISRDNTFRFQDIKARFYEHFISMAEDIGKLECAKPELFPLSNNYRSHQGILSLAANIVEMLCNGFRGQIDVLPREIGNYPGTKPTIFLGFDYKILAQGNAGMPGTEQAMSDFGAEQVIIVKNEIVKAYLKENPALKSALILTIYQSKGLEFEDVILYSFFSDSIWDNIRLPTLELLLTKEADMKLDKSKYAGLCSELKHLYVAVTRARKNLWIVEPTKSSIQHIVSLWTRKEGREPLVSCVDIEDPEAEIKARSIIKPGKSTSPEAWRDQGEMLLQRALYEDALLCFQRANYKQGENLATAYLLYETASRLDVGASREQTLQARRTFAEAAQLFEDAQFIQKAAETWGAAEQYRKAAEVLHAHKEYGKAAIWYMRANDFWEAAECFHMAGQHDEAVKAYRRGEYWTELLEYLEKYQEFISDSTKTRYSTLINLLLHRGDLPETLLPAALETLGDEKAKEDFYTKFEKTEDLLTFYIERKRYNEYFQLALREGRFEDAVRVGMESRVARDVENDSRVPPEDLLTLYNGLMAGSTWSSIQFDLKNLSQAKEPLMCIPTHTIPKVGKTTVPELRGPITGWKEILDCLQGPSNKMQVPRQGQNIYYAKFFKEFGDDFLDLVEFLRLDTALRQELTQATDMSQLPVSSLQKFASLSGDLLSNRKPPTNLITSMGGLLFSHLQDQFMILDWSPLLSIVLAKGTTPAIQKDGNPAVLTLKQICDALTEWLVPIVARIVPCALRRVHFLLIERTQGPCFQALQGSCRKPSDICKSGKHTSLLPEEVSAHISSLLDAAELSCASQRLYHHRKFPESFSKEYQGNRRGFMERLLKELTYISPLLNDSEIQQEIWRTILGENDILKWSHVRDGLASLFFYRLGPKEWARRGSVSALLEERSLANRLRVMPRFLQFLKYKSYKEGPQRLNFIQGCNSLQQTELAKCNAAILVNRIETITGFIIRTSYGNLQSFHAVLSLYEYLSLELINQTLRVELLVPRSRQQFIRDLTQTSYPSDAEKLNLERCLINLLGDLCDLLDFFSCEYWRLKSEKEYSQRYNLESNSNPEALFFACGKPLWDGNRYMVRRTLDHLTLCMINMGVGRAHLLPRGYNNLRDKIKNAYGKWEFLSPPSPVSWDGPFTPEQIALQFAKVYRNYNKEELLIIGTAKSRPRFQFLSGPKLRRVVVGEQQRTPVPVAQVALGTRQMLELSDEETAASRIAQWWRRCSTRLQAHRANAVKRAKRLSQGPASQAEVMIDDIMVDWMTSRHRRHRTILRDSGVAFLSGMLNLKVLVRETHNAAMEGLGAKRGKYKLSSVAVENMQDTITLLEKRKGLLDKSEEMFSKQGEVQLLFRMPASKLEEKMGSALRLLEDYQQEVKNWARDITDCLKEARGY